jgi:hypothetical protein
MEVGILLLVAVLLPLLLTRSPTDDEYEMMKVDWGDPIENLDDGPYDNHPAYLALAKHECKGCEDSAWEVLEIEDDHEGGWLLEVRCTVFDCDCEKSVFVRDDGKVEEMMENGLGQFHEGHVGDYRGPPSYPNDVYDTRTNQYLYDMSKW